MWWVGGGWWAKPLQTLSQGLVLTLCSLLALSLTITEDENTIIDGGSSQSSHWSGQFCRSSCPAVLITGEDFRGVQVVRCIATRHQEDLKEGLQKKEKITKKICWIILGTAHCSTPLLLGLFSN